MDDKALEAAINKFAEYLRAAIAAYEAETGWRLVPVEPTEAMLLALAAAPKWTWSMLTVESAAERYRAMLEAAPLPEQETRPHPDTGS